MENNFNYLNTDCFELICSDPIALCLAIAYGQTIKALRGCTPCEITNVPIFDNKENTETNTDERKRVYK